MLVECIVGNRTEQHHRVLWNRGIWSTDTAVIHVGKNDLYRRLYLDFVTGELY
jgi:hypothetical protein